MRNEARNAQGCIDSVLCQIGISDLKVSVLDDYSSDATGEILKGIKDVRFTWRAGSPLPSGWLGKNFALHTLVQGATSEYLVFIDADVRLRPDAISKMITLMKKLEMDYISPYPQQLAASPIERLIQPLLQWSWFASLPLLLAERSLRPSTVVANGQFFIVRRSAYEKCGGHEEIRMEVLDDMELARSLRRVGARGTVVEASSIATCRMYENGPELVAGYLKSQWRAFGGLLGATIAIKLLALTSIIPALFAINGSVLGMIGYLAIVATRLAVAIRTKSSLLSPWLHPLAVALWIWLIVRSIFLKKSGQLSWRGRTI